MSAKRAVRTACSSGVVFEIPISIYEYVVWLKKVDAMHAEIHDAPRKRRIVDFKRCAKVMRKKGFSDEFIRVAMGPLFTEDADWQTPLRHAFIPLYQRKRMHYDAYNARKHL